MEKSIGDLELSDFGLCPIWEHPMDAGGDLDLSRVRPAPAKQTIADGDANLWIRFYGSLADGTPVRGIAYAESPPPRLLLWSFYINDQWFALHLPPAPDFVLARSGPTPFAASLNRRMADVFPIRIVSEVHAACTGQPISMEIIP